MTRILITRGADNKVRFEEVTIVDTDNVFFLNRDTLEPHHPDIADDPLGPAPSPPSSQCIPKPKYTCLIAGHEEEGKINIVPALSPVNASANNVVQLAAAVRGQPITPQQLMSGGASPYKISIQVFEIVDAAGTVIQQGAGVGPGLQVSGRPNDQGVWVSGTPTVSGTYIFTFSVDDAAGTNVQQVQYRMVVS